MRKYKQEIIWQEVEQSINNLLRLNLIKEDQYDAVRHEFRRGIRTAFERIKAKEMHLENLRNKQAHNKGGY